MADSKAVAKKAEPVKRTVLTPQQKIEKLERELEAVRAKAAEKDSKVSGKLLSQRAKLVAQIDERQAKVDDIDEQLQLLGVEPTDSVTAEPTADSGIVLPE